MSGILEPSTAVQGQRVSLSGQKMPAANAARPSSPAEADRRPLGGGGDGFCHVKDRGPAGLSPLCTGLRQKRSPGRFRGDFSARQRVESRRSRSSRGEKTRGENTHRVEGIPLPIEPRQEACRQSIVFRSRMMDGVRERPQDAFLKSRLTNRAGPFSPPRRLAHHCQSLSPGRRV
jgi:hypothetical protein